MANLIIILGDLATGKSTLAKKLSEATNSFCLIKDTMKEVLADDIGFTNRAENKKLSIASVSMMKYLFLQYSHLQKDLILEANFHLSELNELASLAEKLNYHLITLYLEGPADILYKRFMHRLQFENRHKAHCTDDLITEEGFLSYSKSSRIEVKDFPKNLIQVTENNYDEVFQKALEIISQ